MMIHSIFSERFLVMVFSSLTFLATSGTGIRAQEEQQNPPTLDSLKLEFDVQRAELMKPVAELRKIYEGKLNELLDQVTKAGDLKKALAVRAELATYKDKQGGAEKAVAAEEEAVFPELKRLQEIFVETQGQRIKAANGKLAPLVEAYKTKLMALQKHLTQENKLEEAVEVQTVLQAVEAEFSVAELPPAAAEMEKKEEEAEKFSWEGKTASFPHNTKPDFIVNVKFEDDGKATWIGLGNIAVEWAWKTGETPLVVYFWSANQNRTWEGGFKITIEPDGRTGVVTRAKGSGYEVPAKISRSRR